VSLQLDSAKRQFDDDGFTILERFFDTSALGNLHRQLDRYLAEVAPTVPAHDALYEDRADPGTLFRLERMEQYDPFFRELLHEPRLVELAGRFLDDGVAPRGVEMFGKAPRGGNPTPPHQDGYYFKLDPMLAMTFWIALDPADETNGSVRYVRGSHRRGMRPHASSQTLGFSQGIVDFGAPDLALESAAPVAPGDVIAHHCMTIHRTDANPTDRPRRALGCVYYGQSARIDRDATASYQKETFERWRREGRI
jgi:phytanoyl-CoA hydroxylase